MASSEASQNGIQPFRMYPALMKSPGVCAVSSLPPRESSAEVDGADDEEIFKGLDKSLATFQKYNMTVVMTLSNFCKLLDPRRRPT